MAALVWITGIQRRVSVRLIASKSNIIGGHTWAEALDMKELLHSDFAATSRKD
jgi:hypothetical protein